MLTVSMPGPTLASPSSTPLSPSFKISSRVPPAAPTSNSSLAVLSAPKSLTVVDKIYGEFLITEPVLVELINSDAIQRLKSVLQHGITALIRVTPQPPITRYEHSIGAMLLVRQAGGSVEAQASALLHDVAHTALSHVVDGVFGYVVHEDDKMEYLTTTSVPAILSKHNLNVEEIMDEANYPLLELPAPAICADRLDYGIRDSESFGFLTREEASSIARDLRVSKKGTFCFASVKWAERLGEAYMQSDEYAWSNPLHSRLYRWAADTIREAHATGLMAKSELWEGGDETFWEKMVHSPSERVRSLAAKVVRNIRVEEITDVTPHPDIGGGDDATFSHVAKIRTLDPDVLMEGGDVRPLSELDEVYKTRREAYLAKKAGLKHYSVTRVSL